CARQAVQATDW
nr:immunoglobulin heavy chain junction region [Mus musculus]